MFTVLEVYQQVGFQGPLIPDHTPRVVGNDREGHRGRAVAIGYIKGSPRGVS